MEAASDVMVGTVYHCDIGLIPLTMPDSSWTWNWGEKVRIKETLR